MPARLKVGIYGGTFDPPHNAHINLARFALAKLSLDLIYIVPAKGHALKNNEGITPAEIRFELVKSAFADEEKIRVSRIELDGPETSYTIATLEQFAEYENLGQTELYYLIGADNMMELHLWKEPDRIFNLATLVVLRRPGYQSARQQLPFSGNVEFLDSPHYNISSTEIRERIRTGQTVKHLIPQNVYKLIERYRLYRPLNS